MILRTRHSLPAGLRCRASLVVQARGRGSLLRTSTSIPILNRTYSSTPKSQDDEIPTHKDEQEKHDVPLIRYVTKEARRLFGPRSAATTSRRQRGQGELERIKRLSRANVKERYDPLKIKALGRDTSVVVLSDSRIRLNEPVFEPEEIENEAVDFAGQLEDEVGMPSADEVYENIESLRPKGGKKELSWKKIENLQKDLEEGFTTTQLFNYIYMFEKKAKDLPEAEQAVKNEVAAEYAGKHLERVSKWMPGLSEDGDAFKESYLRGYTSEASTKKQVAAMIIMRSCWKLTAKEMEGSIGEVEVEIGREDLTFLISEKMVKSPLKRISDNLIRTEDEKIEVFKARSVIRITGTPAQTKQIVDAIGDSLENMHTARVSLNGLKSKDGKETEQFGDEELEQIQRLTNAEITKVSSGSVELRAERLRSGSGLSSPADSARRLLLASSDIADTSIRTVACKAVSEPVHAVAWPVREGMSWRNKLRQWARWSTPVSRPKLEIEDGEGIDSVRQTMDEVVPALHAASLAGLKATGAESPDTLWASAPIIETSAMIGNVLHETSGAQSYNMEFLDSETPASSKSRTVFAPSTVNILKLISNLTPIPKSTKSLLVMKFLPSPWTPKGPSALASFPPIEMQLKQEEADLPPKVDKINAYTHIYKNDLMLPDAATDISFQQHVFYPLPIEQLEANDCKPIRDFLDKSTLSGSILCPPEVTIPIPGFLCKSHKDGSTDQTLTEVPYLFAGLEFRQQSSFDYRGWRLKYTSVNGGKAGGARAEVVLEYLRTALDKPAKQTEPVIESTDSLLREYSAAAFQLVEDLTNPEDIELKTLEEEPEILAEIRKTREETETATAEPLPLPPAKYVHSDTFSKEDQVQLFRVRPEVVKQWKKRTMVDEEQ